MLLVDLCVRMELLLLVGEFDLERARRRRATVSADQVDGWKLRRAAAAAAELLRL